MRIKCLLFLLALCSISWAGQVDAARGVVSRLLGARTREFDLYTMPAAGGKDVFAIEASNGRVRVGGSSGVAIARGVYHYLKSACHCLVTWEGNQLALPKVLPDFAKATVACPNTFRHYFNVCTFGYTTAFWDWKRWEKEIDWMALHGINMPLAMTGQEDIWQRVWKSYGLSQREVDEYFTGPAFLPWHRMGNVNGHAGPIPQSWHKGQTELQRKILARERELGMMPVTPAFSGFVPPGFAKKHPEADCWRSAEWAGFEPTYLMNPRAPLFTDIGIKFLKEYAKEFGESHYYLADVFNEMTPQVGKDTKLQDLSAMGDAVYKTISTADPRGTWVMQGWLFYNDRGFWGELETEAFLKPVPDDRMIVVDLACDQYEVWRQQPAVRKKQWIWCVLHNFGQNTALSGNLPLYASRASAAINDSNRGNMVGMGITMEGIEQNSVNYELATDAMWQTEAIQPSEWLRSFVRCRYGGQNERAQDAWGAMLKLIYSGSYRTASYLHRPDWGGVGEPGDGSTKTRTIVQELLACSDELRGNAMYRRDLVDVMKRYLDECGENLLYEAAMASDTKKSRGSYLDLLTDIDALLDTCPEHRLSKWIAMSRSWGKDKSEKDFFEWNARMQITVWGGPVLYDYAAKEWSALVSDFYRERWKMLFDGKDAKAISDWEWAWTKRTDAPPRAKPGDTIELCRKLLEKYSSIPTSTVDRGIATGKPTTDSGGTEQGGSPANAVDGRAGGSYWAASPAPQWWQVDMERTIAIGGIRVFPYWDGSRYYRYTIEVSDDGKAWRRVANMSENTTPATARGTLHEFPATIARYVRVNMLSNSANIGVHLYEVRVFPPKG